MSAWKPAALNGGLVRLPPGRDGAGAVVIGCGVGVAGGSVIGCGRLPFLGTIGVVAAPAPVGAAAFSSRSKRMPSAKAQRYFVEAAWKSPSHTTRCAAR